MNHLDMIEQDPDLARSLLEPLLDRVRSYWEIGIRAGKDLTPEQKGFLQRDQHSLVMLAAEKLEQAEQDFDAMNGYEQALKEQEQEARIEAIYSDGRFGE